MSDGGRRPRRWRGRLVRAVLVALVLAAAWHYIDLDRLGASLLGAQRSLLLPLLALATIDRFLMSAKWHQLLRAADVPARFGRVLSAYYQSAFVGRVLPSSLSGELWRGYVVVRSTEHWERVLGSMVVERAIAAMAAAALASAGVAVLGSRMTEHGAHVLVWAVPAVAVASAAVFWLSLSERVVARLIDAVRHAKAQRVLRRLHAAYALYGTRRLVLLGSFALALSEIALVVVYLWLCSRAVGVDAPALHVMATLMLSEFFRKFAIILEGWVVGEFTVVVTCALAGIDQTHALALSLLAQAVGFVASAPGGVLALLARHERRVAPPQGAS